MTELIKITTEGDNQVVNARDLHAFLEVKTDFTNWIKRQIKYYDFVEGEDYVSLDKNVQNSEILLANFDEQDENKWGGSNKTDYAISLDMAKELSMVARTPKGKQARQYFIQVEKQFKTNQIQQISEMNTRLIAVEERMKEINGQPGEMWETIFSFVQRKYDKKLSVREIIEYEKECNTIAIKSGYKRVSVDDPVLGTVGKYSFVVLSPFFTKKFPYG